MADQLCRLLELPGELRSQILSELLQPTEIWLATQYGEDNTHCAIRYYGTTCGKQRTYPAVLGTCHQVNHEAKGLLFEPLKLRFTPAMTVLDNRMRFIDLRKIATITQLEEICVHFLPTSVHNPSHSHAMIDFIRRSSLHAALQHVRILVVNPTSHYVFKLHMQLAELWFRLFATVPKTTVLLQGGFASGAIWRKEKDGQWADATIFICGEKDVQPVLVTARNEAKTKRKRYFEIMREFYAKAIEPNETPETALELSASEHYSA